MKKLLFVWSMTCKESSYIQKALDCIKSSDLEVHRVFLNSYPDFDDSGYDFLIYNTFAAEPHPKFEKDITRRSDEKFYKFPGKVVLLDSHDDGTLDGFERMRNRAIPRIKYTPGYDFMKEYNVIMALPIKVRWFHRYKGEEKTIPIIYTGVKEPFPHTIRREVADRLIPFDAYTKREKSAVQAGRLLRSSKISIGVPGWGPIGSAHCEALAAKALLFSHQDVKKVKLLPFAELEDNFNYVPFAMENLEEKLSILLKDEEAIRFIAENGYQLFKEGYSPERTAKQIVDYFKGGQCSSVS
jgi:hypothetical protein